MGSLKVSAFGSDLIFFLCNLENPIEIKNLFFKGVLAKGQHKKSAKVSYNIQTAIKIMKNCMCVCRMSSQAHSAWI